MMRTALAERIITRIYSFRNMCLSSYVLVSLIFFTVNLSSYLFRGLISEGIVSSCHESSFESLLFLASLCAVNHEDSNDEGVCDHVEDIGGNGVRVAAYLRVSTGKQAKQGSSLPAQKELLTKLKGEIRPSRIHWFVDAGKSADSIDFDRRKTNLIMQLADAKQVEELWVTRIDRIGRKCIDLLLFFFKISKKGVTIRTPERAYSSKDLSSVLMLLIEAWVSEEENRRRAKSAMASKIQRFKAKKWNKASAPFGYRRKGEWLEKDPILEPVVRDAYDLFLNLRNIESVRAQLSGKYRHLTMEPITRYRLASILSDPTYVGKPQHLNETANDPSLVCVDEERFAKAQETLRQIHRRFRPDRAGPLRDLISACGISALEFLDQLEFRHKACGGSVVRNGTRHAKNARYTQQVFLCKKCGNQWAIPNTTQLERIREYFLGNTGECNLMRQRTSKSIYPLVGDSRSSEDLGESGKMKEREAKKKRGQIDNGSRSLNEFQENA